MKKKSKIGYVANDWFITLPRGHLKDFNYVNHSKIYREAFTDSLKNKFYKKVRITIQEL